MHISLLLSSNTFLIRSKPTIIPYLKINQVFLFRSRKFENFLQFLLEKCVSYGGKEKAIYTEKEGNVGICNLKKISCVVSFPSPSFSSIRESFAIICCARNMARISASLDLINSLVAANNPASFRDRDLDAAKSSALTNFNNNRGRKGEFGTYRSSSSTNPFSSIILARSTVYRTSVKFRSIGSQYSVSSRFKFDCLTRLPCFAWKTLSPFAVL